MSRIRIPMEERFFPNIDGPLSFIADTVETSATRNIGTEFYGDLVYRIRKIVGKSNFAEQFRKRIHPSIYFSADCMVSC